MQLRIRNIGAVAEAQLCTGCGACAYLSPREIHMVDTLEGRRPSLSETEPDAALSADALRACPGLELAHTFDPRTPDLLPALTAGWGPVREVWEGFAADPELRFAGSSGGAASALALYCLEQGGSHGLLHIAARPDAPYLNHTVLSTTRAEILSATGSRYAPASPCDGLQMVADAPRPCVFIGKPCDVAAAESARRMRPELDRNLGLTIAIFCAGTPTTRGTLALLQRMGVDDPATVVSLRYRGNGWPGRTVLRVRTPEGERTRSLTYDESWGEVLTNHKQWRCHVCADHTGEFADIAVGDPWYRPLSPDEPGQSLVLVRTERGRAVLHAALRAGYLKLERANPATLPASQPNLLAARGAVWGRLLTLRLLGLPAPRFRGMRMGWFWLTRTSLVEKLRSLIGTVRRAGRRGLRQRQVLRPYLAPPPEPAPASDLPAYANADHDQHG